MMKKKVAKRLCKYKYFLTTYPTNARNKKFSMLFVTLPLVVIYLYQKSSDKCSCYWEENAQCSFFSSLTETHQIAQANEEKNAKFKEAFGIKDDYKGGTAFNQELQAIERIKEREAKEKEMKKYESR